MKLLLSLLLCGTFSLPASAYITDDEDPFAGKTEFNGMKLGQFGDFAKDWKLVTVRFRKDSGEMRFTYANPSAWKTLAKNSSDYPDGAIFAKISIGTEPDPAFESSAVPSGAKRVQFMVRNKKKYQETDGWGYALFKGDGTTFPGDPKPAVIACHACHRLVPERGFVFSLPSTFDGFGTNYGSMFPLKTSAGGIRFETIAASALGKKIRAHLPKGTKNVRVLRSVITKHVFFGTLDEIKPSLILEAQKSGLPAVLVSDDSKQFSLAFLDGESDCPGGSRSVALARKSNSDRKPRSEEVCL